MCLEGGHKIPHRITHHGMKCYRGFRIWINFSEVYIVWFLKTLIEVTKVYFSDSEFLEKYLYV